MAGYDIPYAMPDMTGVDLASLPEIRRRVLTEIIPQVVPSREGDPKFHRLASKENLKSERKNNPNFTTCGALPGFVFGQLGIRCFGPGLDGNRMIAEAIGCWVDPWAAENIYDDLMPKPGDVYLLSGVENTQFIYHTAIMVNPFTNPFWSADAGQGAKTLQMAIYVPHEYNSGTGILTSKPHGALGFTHPRRLRGWIDLEKVAAIMGRPDGQQLAQAAMRKVAEAEKKRREDQAKQNAARAGKPAGAY